MQRFFVWAHGEGYALPLSRQLPRYGVVAGSQYAATAIVTAYGPRVIDLSPTTLYLAWMPLVACITFVLFGRRVFHARAND